MHGSGASIHSRIGDLSARVKFTKCSRRDLCKFPHFTSRSVNKAGKALRVELWIFFVVISRVPCGGVRTWGAGRSCGIVTDPIALYDLVGKGNGA